MTATARVEVGSCFDPSTCTVSDDIVCPDCPACRLCGEKLRTVDGPGTPDHLRCPGKLLLDFAKVEWPEGTTLEQKQRVLVLAADFRAVRVGVGPGSHGFLPDSWLYVVVYPLHGGEFHCGVEPDGSSHS